jgi:hypothetical protein
MLKASLIVAHTPDGVGFSIKNRRCTRCTINFDILSVLSSIFYQIFTRFQPPSRNFQIMARANTMM